MENVERLTGFVALLDVLGFRELVSRDDDLSRVRQYIEAVATLLSPDGPSQLQFVLFSDNLVINTRDDSVDSFRGLVQACSHLSFELAQQRVAVRGAIAHGPFMRSPTTRQGVILAGRPIVEADHYQHAQDWVGTILAPSVVRRDDGIGEACQIRQRDAAETPDGWAERRRLSFHLHHWPQIPFHKGSPFDDAYFDGYVLVPMRQGVSSPSTVQASLRDFRRQLEIMKAGAPDPASQAKYSKTLNWIGGVSSAWTSLSSW